MRAFATTTPAATAHRLIEMYVYDTCTTHTSSNVAHAANAHAFLDFPFGQFRLDNIGERKRSHRKLNGQRNSRLLLVVTPNIVVFFHFSSSSAACSHMDLGRRSESQDSGRRAQCVTQAWQRPLPRTTSNVSGQLSNFSIFQGYLIPDIFNCHGLGRKSVIYFKMFALIDV